MKKFLLASLLLLAGPLPAHAWWDDGHMVVAQIAYDRLRPTTRVAVDKLVPLGATDKNNTFVTAAVWADDLKGEGVHFFDAWHYADTPLYEPYQGKPGEKPYEAVYPRTKPDGDLLWALAENTRILKSAKASDFERARALRFVIHLVGDAHQPLHCVSRYSADAPHGDRGGNDFRLAPEGTDFDETNGYLRNLHSYWDSAAGWLAVSVPRPLSAEGKTRIAAWAAAAQAEQGSPTAPDRDFYRWIEEGADIARTSVYRTPEGALPDAAYTTEAQRICRRQLATAGLRLADLLNDCL